MSTSNRRVKGVSKWLQRTRKRSGSRFRRSGSGAASRVRQSVALLRRALALLPEDKREVLVLSRFQNLRYEEIGRILDCEPGTVKVRVYRAVRQLEQIYNELAGEKAS